MKIEIKSVSKKFKDNEVIKKTNLVLESGNIYGFYGRNGSGKSVFQKLLCGLYMPTSGNILYDGIDINEKHEFPLNVRAQIETPTFFHDLSGFKNLQILAEIQNKISDNDIIKALEIVNLIEEKDKIYAKYSLGMKQKLGIAQAIMENPDVIILDEPFNGIERVTVNKIIDFLIHAKNEGKLIIVSSHIKEDLNAMANVFYEFDNGTIVEVNSAK